MKNVARVKENDKIKSLMFVEASSDLLPWFKRAREFGYRCVVCGTDSSKEMAREADAYYDMPYSDRDGCIAIAEKERVDGVIGGGDQSALTAAYVAKSLSLPGNDPRGMERMMNKQEFRELQKELGLPFPEFVYASELESFIEQVRNMAFPIIVKPGQMSSSGGVKVFDYFDRERLVEQFRLCKDISNNDVVCAEHYYVIPDRIFHEFNPFVCGDEIIWAGDMVTIHSRFNPEVPSGSSWPMSATSIMRAKAERDILKVLKATNYVLGEVDVESFFNDEGDFVILEINPRRCGGGMQKYVKLATGCDYIGMLVSLAVGDNSFFENQIREVESAVALSVFFPFSAEVGKFKDIVVCEELKPYFLEKTCFVEKGESINVCRNFYDRVGIVAFQFPSIEIQKRYIYRMEDFIHVI